MTKQFCDICGKEMNRITTISDSISKESTCSKSKFFAISENGKFWDVCDECRIELSEWIRNRKKGWIWKEKE